MPKRITQLSDEQESAMPEWAAQWIRVGLCTDEADWDSFTDGCRRCYGYAGLRWHGNVVKVGNPLVLSLAAPLAAYLFNPSVRGRGVSAAVRTAVRDPVHDAVYSVVRPPVHDMVHDAVRVPVNVAADGAIGGGVARCCAQCSAQRGV